MEQFHTALVEALRPTLAGSILLAAVTMPLLVWAGAVLLHLRLERDFAPPQKEKLLRPPGYSLFVRMDDLLDSMLQNLIWATLMFAIAGGAAGTAALLARGDHPLAYTFFCYSLLLVSIMPGTALIFRAYRKACELRNTRLDLRGEQAVAEVLHELGEAGYRAFHDLQPESTWDTWNIDHILVGARGVFLIETKARRRRPPNREGHGEQAKHVVIYDGRGLTFPCGTDTSAIPQAQENADWLTDFLSKRIGEVVQVEPLVVIPGWYVEAKGNFPVKVMNTNYARSYLRDQPAKIDPAQVRRIIAALDDRCRTLEF